MNFCDMLARLFAKSRTKCGRWGAIQRDLEYFLRKKLKKKPGEQVDLVAHLLASWHLYQVPRFFNTLLPVGGSGHADAL